MTLADLKTTLAAVLPNKVAYNAWPESEAPTVPYITMNLTGSDNWAADNVVYFERQPVNIELYEAIRDFKLEADIQDALTKAGLYWERTDAYIEDEKIYEIIYEVTLNG